VLAERAKKITEGFKAPLDRQLYMQECIGDLHGRVLLLEKILEKDHAGELPLPKRARAPAKKRSKLADAAATGGSGAAVGGGGAGEPPAVSAV
jgi:hypothetical protein